MNTSCELARRDLWNEKGGKILYSCGQGNYLRDFLNAELRSRVRRVCFLREPFPDPVMRGSAASEYRWGSQVR